MRLVVTEKCAGQAVLSANRYGVQRETHILTGWLWCCWLREIRPREVENVESEFVWWARCARDENLAEIRFGGGREKCTSKLGTVLRTE